MPVAIQSTRFCDYFSFPNPSVLSLFARVIMLKVHPLDSAGIGTTMNVESRLD